MFLYIMTVIFVILQIADICTTQRALKSSNAVERNPIVRAVMNKIGIIQALVCIKIIVVAVIINIVVFFPSIYLIGVLIALNIFYTIVVFNNYRVANV